MEEKVQLPQNNTFENCNSMLDYLHYNFCFPTHPFEEKKHLSHLNLYKSCIIYPQKINNAYKVTTAE